MDNFVHGLFKSERNAAAAVQSLIDAHFDPEAISALMRVEHEVQEAMPTYKTGVGVGSALGAAVGAAGGIIGAIGGFLAAGPLLGAVAGSAAGYLVGALAGLGRWRDEIEVPAHTQEGMILVGVSTEEDNVALARDALAAAGPERIHLSRKNEACTELETGKLSATGLLTTK